MPPLRKVEIYDKNWANGYFRQSIQFLKEGSKSEGFWLWNQRLAAALLLKKELEEKGFLWQSRRIENHIHRLQPKGLSNVQKNNVVHESVFHSRPVRPLNKRPIYSHQADSERAEVAH
jgi:hypothetical protein